MGMYTNEGLVKHAKAALKLKTKYMWAGTLTLITDSYIDAKVRQCRSIPASRSGYTELRVQQLHALANQGFYGVDCVCLLKSYIWSGNADGGTGSPKYDSKSDLNAGDMFARATVKGKIDTLPETPGIVLISRTHGNHIGIYIGDGETIESTLGSRGDGVVKRKLEKNFWTDWFECPFIEYRKPVVSSPSLKTVTLAYNARIRSAPRYKSEDLGLLTAGTQCIVCVNSKQTDAETKYEYIKLYNRAGWIVTSAIK